MEKVIGIEPNEDGSGFVIAGYDEPLSFTECEAIIKKSHSQKEETVKKEFEEFYRKRWKIDPDWSNEPIFVNQWEAFKAAYLARLTHTHKSGGEDEQVY